MALALNFSLCQTNSCKDLQFTETTGIYSTSNPGGWYTGPLEVGPNPKISDATSAILTSTSPSGIVYITDMEPLGFPSSNISYSTIITLTGDSLEDGKWTFVYTIVVDDITYTKTIYKLFTCNSECCVKQMHDNIELSDCGCGDYSKELNEYLTAWTFLESLKNAAKCGNVDLFDKLKKIVDKLCKNKDCKTCK